MIRLTDILKNTSTLNEDKTFWPFETGKTEIWYMKKEWFRAGSGGDLPDKKNLKKTHILLGKVNYTRPEEVYAHMQGHVWSPNGEARDLIRSKNLSHTSMSVGDVLKVGNKAFVVSLMGFKELK